MLLKKKIIYIINVGIFNSIIILGDFLSKNLQETIKWLLLI